MTLVLKRGWNNLLTLIRKQVIPTLRIIFAASKSSILHFPYSLFFFSRPIFGSRSAYNQSCNQSENWLHSKPVLGHPGLKVASIFCVLAVCTKQDFLRGTSTNPRRRSEIIPRFKNSNESLYMYVGDFWLIEAQP
jgi:hypothetical protein